MVAVQVIDLNISPRECGICGYKWEQSNSVPSYGVARYEDVLVPDDYKGEWGGMEVCEHCFKIERLLRAAWPDMMIPFSCVLLTPMEITPK